MSEIAVQLENCSRLFGKVRAADRVSLTIRQNEFFTILGASGSGKTTTLRMIDGFEEPDEGRVLIAGQLHPVAPAVLIPFRRNETAHFGAIADREALLVSGA